MTTGSKVWASLVILGILTLGGLAIAGNNKSESAKSAALAAERNGRVAQQTSDRTECIRGIAAELDHARWALVGKAFNLTTHADAQMIGHALNDLPLITTLANHGGDILGERVRACPPAPTTKEAP